MTYYQECRMTSWNKDATHAANSCGYHEQKGPLYTYLRKNDEDEDVRGYRQKCCSTRPAWDISNNYMNNGFIYPRYDPWEMHRSPRRRSPRRRSARRRSARRSARRNSD
jgi:hypothetical protein